MEVLFIFLALVPVPELKCNIPFVMVAPDSYGVRCINKVAKLLVGLSFTAAPVLKPLGVQLLPLPEESFPNVVAVVPELSNHFKIKEIP